MQKNEKENINKKEWNAMTAALRDLMDRLKIAELNGDESECSGSRQSLEPQAIV